MTACRALSVVSGAAASARGVCRLDAAGHIVVCILVSGIVIACAAAPAPLPPAQATQTTQTVQSQAPTSAAVSVHGFEVVRAYPHDATAFTQGLVYRDGFLYESTGLQGQSTLRKLEIPSGRVVQRREMAADIFAEGLTIWNNTLVQLTWQHQMALVYALPTFAPQSSFAYQGEGWGLTHDGSRLIMSDGTPALRFLDPASGRETSRVQVTDSGRPIAALNELEFVGRFVYANVWHTDRIAVIDPATGNLAAWIDLTGLRPAASRQDAEAVLNGIAYDEAGDRLFVTGKRWPTIFEITVRPPVSAARGRAGR
jgi:glutaminyl-peptide cyclotransferase